MSIINNLLSKFKNKESFSMEEAYTVNPSVNKNSVRARIYENLGKTFNKIARGVYSISQNEEECILLEGDGRDLSMLKDNSIDCIITDHPWLDNEANKGGGRNFVSTYTCFKYTQEDFNEKARVLKNGCFICEFVPTETATNTDYRHDIIVMARKAGFELYAKVPWKKGNFVANVGRKKKNTEDILIFTKGKAKALRPDVKKDLADPSKKHYMSGAKGMLPTEFDYNPPSKKERIHQAEKPLGLIEELLDFFTFPDETVLDQFAGSGVVGEACLKKKRKSILIEKDKNHIDTIIKRLNLTPVPSLGV